MDRVTFGWWPPLEAATATKTDCITVGDGLGGLYRPLNLFVQKEFFHTDLCPRFFLSTKDTKGTEAFSHGSLSTIFLSTKDTKGTEVFPHGSLSTIFFVHERHEGHECFFGLFGNVLQWPPQMAATHRRVTKHGSSYLRVVAAIGGGHCNQADCITVGDGQGSV